MVLMFVCTRSIFSANADNASHIIANPSLDIENSRRSMSAMPEMSPLWGMGLRSNIIVTSSSTDVSPFPTASQSLHDIHLPWSFKALIWASNASLCRLNASITPCVRRAEVSASSFCSGWVSSLACNCLWIASHAPYIFDVMLVHCTLFILVAISHSVISRAVLLIIRRRSCAVGSSASLQLSLSARAPAVTGGCVSGSSLSSIACTFAVCVSISFLISSRMDFNRSTSPLALL